jgi:hypothetical protein
MEVPRSADLLHAPPSSAIRGGFVTNDGDPLAL